MASHNTATISTFPSVFKSNPKPCIGCEEVDEPGSVRTTYSEDTEAVYDGDTDGDGVLVDVAVNVADAVNVAERVEVLVTDAE